MGLLGVAWSNILVGVLAALLVGVVTHLKNYAYYKYLERQYPIAGDYITTFEDEEDGEEFIATAPAKLEQQGKTITGRTAMPDDDRQWVLEGEISEKGYINGIYYAVDPHDSGVGNFFLYINYDRHMEGMWSGYDEVNDQISSGRYTFTPVFDAFQLQELAAENIPAVVDIADRRLGKDYLSADLLKSSLEKESDYFTRIAVIESKLRTERSIADRLAERILDRQTPKLDTELIADDTKSSEVIGFCIGAVVDQDELRSYLNVGASELPDGLRYAERIGIIRTVAVRKGFENRGVGTDLVQDCIENCIDRDATALCSVGWEEEGEVNIDGIMDYFDFNKSARFEEYWRGESLEYDYHCENCGEPPCTCPAVLFTRYV